MRKIYVLVIALFAFVSGTAAQDIVLDKRAAPEQVYLDSSESDNPLPFNDLNIEFGYVLYQSEITIEAEESELKLENVRDYAVVFVDGKLQGTLTDNRKKLLLNVAPGKYHLNVYVENIGRITYGPEILDNSKGMFGDVTLDGDAVETWTMTPLGIRGYDVSGLIFDNDMQESELPCFHKGAFEMGTLSDCYLDISGWGMGEVWINGKYMGSYWEEEKQQSIQVPASDLKVGRNEIIVFEMKNNRQKSMKLVDNPVFK